MSIVERIPHWQDGAHQASDYVRTFTLNDNNGNPFNFTGYECQVQWRTEPQKPAAISLSVGSGITITYTSGIIEVKVTQAQLAAIPAENYTWDLIVKHTVDGTYDTLVVVELNLEARSTVWE
ncbi:MAG: hypothetical protein K8R40_02250 [Anaerolineaceae bacterium]|nr:hypothetical protein [Anaerolineaceae bacterium]